MYEAREDESKAGLLGLLRKQIQANKWAAEVLKRLEAKTKVETVEVFEMMTSKGDEGNEG